MDLIERLKEIADGVGEGTAGLWKVLRLPHAAGDGNVWPETCGPLKFAFIRDPERENTWWFVPRFDPVRSIVPAMFGLGSETVETNLRQFASHLKTFLDEKQPVHVSFIPVHRMSSSDLIRLFDHLERHRNVFEGYAFQWYGSSFGLSVDPDRVKEPDDFPPGP